MRDEISQAKENTAAVLPVTARRYVSSVISVFQRFSS